MKKFLVLSAIVGLAGVGVGVVQRQDSSATTVEAATDTSTTVTAAPPVASSPATTRKAVARATTPTTVRRMSAPVAPALTTTRPVATAAVTTATTTAAPTTTTTLATPAPACSVIAANPSVHKGDTQTISVTSNMPATRTRLTIQYPKFDTGRPNPRLTYSPTTDASGAVTQSFTVAETSTVPVPVTVAFYNVAGQVMSSSCSTTFQST